MLAAPLGGWEVVAILIAALAFWIWMVVDCAAYERNRNAKLLWLLLMIFGNLFGAPLYFLFRKMRRKGQHVA
jgi:hypothetical protein